MRKLNTMAVTVAMGAVLLTACGGTNTGATTSAPPDPASTAAPSTTKTGATTTPTESAAPTEAPVPLESSPPGDIPDTIAFVPYNSSRCAEKNSKYLASLRATVLWRRGNLHIIGGDCFERRTRTPSQRHRSHYFIGSLKS